MYLALQHGPPWQTARSPVGYLRQSQVRVWICRLHGFEGTVREAALVAFGAIAAEVKRLVRIVGLEPTRLAPLPPQSSVSTSSTISAEFIVRRSNLTGSVAVGSGLRALDPWPTAAPDRSQGLASPVSPSPGSNSSVPVSTQAVSESAPRH
jgi:hypothetical protein